MMCLRERSGIQRQKTKLLCSSDASVVCEPITHLGIKAMCYRSLAGSREHRKPGCDMPVPCTDAREKLYAVMCLIRVMRTARIARISRLISDMVNALEAKNNNSNNTHG